MHGRTRQPAPPDRVATLSHPTGAVTWIDPARAVIARTATSGGVALKTIRSESARGRAPFLARVVDEIGDRDRVLILGPDAMRVELEREYVSIYHRPDRILDVEASGPTGQDELVRRLEALTAD